MKKILLPILLLIATQSIFAQLNQTEGSKKLSLINYAITHLYVDTVNESRIVEAGIRAMLEELDPHSAYLTAEEVQESNEELNGNFDGVGISFMMQKDTCYIVQTIAGGPCEKVGVLAGDRIIFINDTIVAGVKMTANDIKKRLRGVRGTTVDVLVKRNGVQGLLPFRITRDQIPVHSVDASYMVAKNTGYVKLSRFAATTFDEFVEAIVPMIRLNRMKNLIIDLQGNGGGYLSAAVGLCNMLLDEGNLIVYTEGRNAPRQEERSGEKGVFREGKLIVLVDEASASASEILAGAVQDWDRGVIVGRRTFGKGLVQRPLQMPDGSMLRLTVAKYYTPTGRSIQRSYSEGNKAYRNDILERYKRGEMISADSIHFVDSLKYTTLKNNRTVFGGGGIMPDCFIPLDTTNFTEYHRSIVAKGVMPQLAAEYSEKNKKEILSQYKRENKFVEEYQVSDSLMTQLTNFAAQEGVEYNDEEYQKSKELMALQMKALIGRDLYEQSTYYKVINTKANEALTRALEIIANEEEYNSLLEIKEKR
ncbi:MAG: S41 family peptidase [Bacteroidales bacterium]|nr:S41 family peptidase [Bacteroidales bacterium]